ncbi:MAG: hypothetical protein KGP01_07190, partial [Actinomycetales bacterium]|nr:hypothetical protein [Actinomycetales bacterium]
SATEAAAAVQPSRARSLAMLVEVSTRVFPETADWLGTAVEQVRRRCEELDAQSPVTLTDYQRAQIAAVLR